MAYLVHEVSVTRNYSCYDISMPIQVFGCALNHNINAQICRPVSKTAVSTIHTEALYVLLAAIARTASAVLHFCVKLKVQQAACEVLALQPQGWQMCCQ